MKHSVDQIDFDIALVACGAYGLPLSTHIKSIGKKSISFRWSITTFIWNYWKKMGKIISIQNLDTTTIIYLIDIG